VQLKTAKAVVAAIAKKKKRKAKHASVLTLGTARFQAAGGHSAKVSIHLSRTAFALLRKDHSLRVIATIKATNPQGKTTTATHTLILRAPAKKHKRSKKHARFEPAALAGAVFSGW
jgi:hypothetical protein